MTNELLTIQARCRANDACLFDGRDLFLDIQITNNQPVKVGFPLQFVQKTGPVIRLIDTRTKADTYLKTNLADFALRDKLTPIPPNGSVALEWVIMADELEQFGEPVDVSAEITVKTDVEVRGNMVEFRGSDTLHVVSKLKH